MPAASELAGAATALNAVLTAGLDQVSNFQQVTFTQYVRKVLPLDGFVFWVNSALINSDGVATTKTVDGYMHLSTSTIQDETELYDRNSVIFTAQEPIDDFNEVGAATLWIGTMYGVRFAFSERTGFNDPADLYHYWGHAIFPHMATQVIDSADDLDLTNQIVSSSLPVWLGLAEGAGLTLYPAMLSDQNIDPAYATVLCENAQSLAAGYYMDVNSNQYQLTKETVKLFFTGLRNNAILDFIRYVTEYTMGSKAELGVMNIPIVQDERVPQNELNTIAQRKIVVFEVNYYQQRTRDVALRLITKAIPQIFTGK